MKNLSQPQYIKTIQIILFLAFPVLHNAFGQEAEKYIARDGSEVVFSPEEMAKKLPSDIKPLFDYTVRDASICTGPDSTYYLTGTTGDPDMWAVTSEIRVWKSKDLKKWTPVVVKPRTRSVVWNSDREGPEWTKKISTRDGAPFRPLWAPEIHYFKGTFWLTYCFPWLGNGILKSTSGKAEGPYVSVLDPDLPISRDIDGSLFMDDDGKVYSVVGNGKIRLMKEDMSAPMDSVVAISPTNASRVGFEGTFLIKANGKYHMICADFINGEYHCFASMADHIYGPYGPRYLAIPHGGHNTFFQDLEGNWWSSFFGNDRNAPFRERPALVRIEFDEKGRIRPASQNFPGDSQEQPYRSSEKGLPHVWCTWGTFITG